MGNIPLATVLNANDVLFAGIMGFIYSDLMVPPLVRVNAKYYGWRVAFYIAGIMFVSIVITALVLDFVFAVSGLIPEGRKAVENLTQFSIDYTFWLNMLFILVAVWLIVFNQKHIKKMDKSMDHGEDGGTNIKRIIVYIFISILIIGLIAFFVTR